MYQCLICLDTLCEEGFCWCGRLELDHKLRVSGETYIQINNLFTMQGEHTNVQEIMEERSRIEKCAKCYWKGLVVPKIGLGCPEHGIWWYKPNTVKGIPTEEHNVINIKNSKAAQKRAKQKHDKRWRVPQYARW